MSEDQQVGGVDPSRAQLELAYGGADRRGEPTPRFSKYSFIGGRRRKIWSEGDREGSFVDRYSGRLWMMAVWVALMNVADSYFTLVHLQAGGIELNPIAGWLLELGRAEFVLYKSSLIALALMVLCIHKNFFMARLGLWVATGTYTVLVLYHLSLFE